MSNDGKEIDDLDTVDTPDDEAEFMAIVEQVERGEIPEVLANADKRELQRGWDRTTAQAGLPRTDVLTGEPLDEPTRRERIRDWPHWTQMAGIVVAAMLFASVSIDAVGFARDLRVQWAHRNDVHPLKAEGGHEVVHIRVPALPVVPAVNVPPAGPGGSATVRLPDSTSVLVAPGATFSSEPSDPKHRESGRRGRLEGEAAIELTAASHELEVSAAVGRVTFRAAGRYAVRAASDELLVTVESGQAEAVGQGAVVGQQRTAGPGQSLLVRRGDPRPVFVTTERR